MEKALQDRLLNSFLNSKFRGVICEFSSGYSGSPVLAVQYEKKNKFGLDGTFIVKIGTEEWALKEQEFYDSLPQDNTRSPLLTQGHMSTPPLEGLAAVAYEVAFNALIQPKTLMDILDEGKKSQQEAQKQVKELARALVDWYISEHGNSQTCVASCYQLVRHMLTKERAENLLEKLSTFLPSWPTGAPHILIEGHEQQLPNPLAYEAICDKISMHPIYPSCRIHGDLHTGNVIYAPQADQLPKLIDFEQSTPDGVPFFDLAYLEFDIIRHLLPVEERKKREEWFLLLNESMSEIQVKKEIPSWEADRTWQFLAPIREEVSRLQQMGGDPYKLVWWLATVATGLNFARKGDETRSLFERMAGLLYAAYGLNRILKMFDVKELSTKGYVPVVPWLGGLAAASVPIEPSSVQEKSTASLVEEIVQSVIETPPVDNSTTQKPQFHLPEADQEPIMEEYESNSFTSPLGAVSLIPNPVAETEPGEEEHLESFSILEANKIRQLLQEVIDLFQKGGIIYKDQCNSADQTLHHFDTFLVALGSKIPEDEFHLLFPQNNLLDSQKHILKDLQRFRESCPPAPARMLAQADYDKECAAISDELEHLQTKFLEFLNEFQQLFP